MPKKDMGKRETTRKNNATQENTIQKTGCPIQRHNYSCMWARLKVMWARLKVHHFPGLPSTQPPNAHQLKKHQTPSNHGRNYVFPLKDIRKLVSPWLVEKSSDSLISLVAIPHLETDSKWVLWFQTKSVQSILLASCQPVFTQKSSCQG